MKKKKMVSAVTVAMLVMGFASTSHAFGNLEISNDMSHRDERQFNEQSGRDSYRNSHNTDLRFNYNLDHRDYSDHRQDSHNDNRDLSDRSQRSTTDSHNDNRDMSDRSNRSDNRDMSDRSNRSDNRIDNQRHQSHNLGDNSIMINGGYQPRVGHESVSVGAVSGSNHVIDNSTSGNFGIGHTTTNHYAK